MNTISAIGHAIRFYQAFLSNGGEKQYGTEGNAGCQPLVIILP
jgi:hypothetical protein